MPKEKSPPVNLDKYLEGRNHKYMTYEKASQLYGLPYWGFVSMAKEAKATWKLRKTAIVDIVVFEKYLEEQGFNSMIAPDLYEFVTLQPGTILPYGYGLAELMNLRYQAQDELKSDFKVSAFHEVILNGGARPFEKVEADVNAWLYGTETPVITPEKEGMSPLMMACIGAAVIVVVIVVMVAGKRKKHGA